MTTPIRQMDSDHSRSARVDKAVFHTRRLELPLTFATRRSSIAAMCLPLFLLGPLSAAEQVTRGSITEVTVYRAQARVVREIPVAASQDLQHVRVNQLPHQLVSGSVFTQTEPGSHVRSLRIISRDAALDAENKKRLEELMQKHRELNSRLALAEQTVHAIEQDLLTVDRLVDFSADKVKQNLDRATLDVQSVTALADFSMQRRRELGNELLKTEAEIDQLHRDIAENDRQQKIVSAASSKPSYEALITVDSTEGGTLRLVYDVDGVNWTPRYSVRSDADAAGKRTFTLQLDAELVQNSGEPWNDVAVTLATSTPDTQAARPLLTPLRVQAVSPGEPQVLSETTPSIPTGSQPSWLDEQLVQRNVYLNSLANSRQVHELTSAAEVQREIADDAGDDVAEETYPIVKQMTIENHRQVQTISILSGDLTGDLHYVVTPLLSSFAFREAELTNTSGRTLIAGDADIYLDGQFVGRTALPPTAAGQKLTIGFGMDRQIRTRRELLAKDQSIQGGNRRSTLAHRLVVTNLHETPMAIRLLDRIPISAQDGSINVTLDRASEETLSQDELYRRIQRPTGVLRWDLEIPAKRFGSDAYDHEYSYSVELDRTQTLVSSDVRQTLGDLRFQKTNMGGGLGGGGSF